jgi:hypothetical protein
MAVVLDPLSALPAPHPAPEKRSLATILIEETCCVAAEPPQRGSSLPRC